VLRLGDRVLSAHPLPVADNESLIRAFRAHDWEYTFVSERHMAAGRSRGSRHRGLRGRMETSPVMDQEGYMRALEQAYHSVSNRTEGKRQ